VTITSHMPSCSCPLVFFCQVLFSVELQQHLRLLGRHSYPAGMLSVQRRGLCCLHERHTSNSATLRVSCYYTGLSKKRAAFVIAQGTFGRGELGKGLGAYMRYILGPEHSTEGGCGGIHHEIYQHTSLFFVSSRICWPRLANMDVSLTSNFCVEHDVVRHPSNNPSRQEYLRVHDNLLFTIHDS
jgi:hypothetical protein